MANSEHINDQLLEFIQNHFPKPHNTRDACNRFIHEKTKKHGYFLILIQTWLMRIVRAEQNGHKRFFCRLDQRNLQKDWLSIAEKIKRDQNKDEDRLTHENFHEKMKDIVRLRIVCNFLSDVNHIKNRIKDLAATDPQIKDQCRIHDTNNTIDMRPRERKSAHRSIKIILESISYPSVFLEIQIMTQLQEAWDNKDHFLIFELHRANPDSDKKNFKDFEDAKMFAMAELLYIADKHFEDLRKQLENSGE